MTRTRIKICGVMRPEDAALACVAGADAVGMIFHPPARRNIDLDRARQIAAAVWPFVTPVGVFVDAPADTLLQSANAIRTRLVQLHGQETPEQARPLAEAGLRILKALRVDATLESQLGMWRDFPALAGIVLESAGPGSGGSGIANDFAAIAVYQRQGLFTGLRIIIAGGLHPENVFDVVRTLRPWAVDVSSGTEESLGIKSREKVLRFISEVRRADACS